MTPELLAIFAQFGPLGLLIAYLVWDKNEQRKVDRERSQSDISLTQALTALTVTISHLAQRFK
jgi:hypothetical protein